ncbi:eukaryotic translation initiation factor 3 subunit M [Kwoniella heveanensis CBS 569]|nr:eukaryotic translation initiation factor 3 subunit M [Kwoniella heveanensis CBS 569]
MADCIPIGPELSFSQQILELATHISRSLPAAEQREFVGTYEAQVKVEGEGDVPEDKRADVVKSLVGKLVELKGGLEGLKESDVESSHLLLQYVLSNTYAVDSDDYRNSVKQVADAVQKGAEASNRQARVDVAAKILNNTYNFLAPSSPLRPTVLLSLLTLLAHSSDISVLPLTTSTLTLALSQWSISSAEKVSFLTSAADLYQSIGDLSKALEILTIALRESVDAKIVDKAVLLNLAVPNKFELDEVLNIQGVKEQLGKAAEVVALFEGDEVEAVEKGKKWAAANGSWVEGAGIPGFTADSVLRKLRLIALLSLCAKAETRQLEYAPVAKALGVEEAEVEAWVIDAIRSKLITARISQPLSLIRIQSISSLSTSSRRFGPSEWQLLEKRLGEWKKSVSEARQVVEEAQNVAAQPVNQYQQQRRGGGGKRDQRQNQNRDQNQNQGQQENKQAQQQEEVAAA